MADNVEDTGGDKPQFTEIEQRASEQGWRPEDQWDGDPAAWRPAKEFLDRGELFKKIDEQNRTIKEFRRALDDLARHHSNVREAEYKRARQELLAQKKDALLEQDADKVIEIDERLDAVKDAQRAAAAAPVVQTQPQLNPDFVQWKEKNSWYGENEAMTAYADRIGNQLAGPGADAKSILVEVERRVKKEFATKFENPARKQPAAVEGGGAKGGAKKESYELSSEERKMMQRFVKTVPGMTEEKYIADLKKIKESR